MKIKILLEALQKFSPDDEIDGDGEFGYGGVVLSIYRKTNEKDEMYVGKIGWDDFFTVTLEEANG